MANYETVERLQCKLSSSDTVLVYGDYVLVAYQSLNGYMAEIYMFSDKVGDIESKLEIMASPNQIFIDGGHAIEWAMNFIKEEINE